MDRSLHVVIPEAPEIAGLAFRRYRGETDLPAMAAVISASLAADGSHERMTAIALANLYARPIHWDPLQDILLVEVDKTLIGCARTERREEPGATVHFVDAYLSPQWRGCGLEPAIQRHMERCAKATACEQPGDLLHVFSTRVPEIWSARVDTLRVAGYEVSRHYLEMERPLLDADLKPVGLPAGVMLRQPLSAHYRAIWEAGDECFRDQRDYVAPTEASYRAWAEDPDLDTSLWVVAWASNQVVGAAINGIQEGGWGETDDLYVRRPWRKRGLGRALLLESLHRFKARGLATAGLGVDEENASGAVVLYESMGYRPYMRVTVYRKSM